MTMWLRVSRLASDATFERGIQQTASQAPSLGAAIRQSAGESPINAQWGIETTAILGSMAASGYAVGKLAVLMLF
jgi:hypothetical protein